MRLGRTSFQDSATASEALLRECWRFRLTLIDLQPGVREEDDWAAFRAYFRPGVELITRRGADGALRAIFAWSMRTTPGAGREHVVLDADYGFAHPDERGRLALPIALARIWGRAARLGRSPTLTLVGSGYPAGVMSFGRVSRRIRSLADPDLEAWERRLLEAHCAGQPCIDRARGVVRMRTRPIEGRREPRTPRSRELLAWYERQVPTWQAGHGLAYLVRFAPAPMLSGGLRQALRRWSG